MKKVLYAACVLLTLALMSCSQHWISSREDEYATRAGVQPVSKIPPGSLLSQRVSH